MFFRRKGWLRKEFDDKLLDELSVLRSKRVKEKELIEKCFEPSEEILCEAKLAELKYFYLIKEAKHRNLTLGK